MLADGSLPGCDRGNQVEPGFGTLSESAEDAKKPFKFVVIAYSMIQDGTEWEAEANGKASAESGAASCETPVDEAKPDEACMCPEESSGDETVEFEA